MSAPDLAVVSESMPATPAAKATKKAKKSGFEIACAKVECSKEKEPGATPVALKIRPAANVTAIAVGKPTASASSERRASGRSRSTSATQKPAIGPNSGPTTMAPTIRIGESSSRPTQAISVASTMKARKDADSCASSEVWNSSCSQMTASDGDPRAARSARWACFESAVSIDCNVIDPSSSRRSSRRSATITLASSRATSARITSPAGSLAAPSRKTTLQTDSAVSSSARVSCERPGGATMRRWYMREGYPLALHRGPHPLGDGDLGQRLRVDEDVREPALDEQRAVAVDGEVGHHAGGAEADDVDRDVDLVVEARGRAVAGRRLDHLK